jgi:hypothetical protein
MKRGQVSVFFIVGIVIIAIIGLLFLISTRDTAKIDQPGSLEDIEDYLTSCIEEILLTSNTVLVEDYSQSEQNVKQYILDDIQDCKNNIDQTFSNVEKLQDSTIQVELTEFNGPGVTGSPRQPERVTVKMNYNANVVINRNSFALNPILVEHEY